MTFPRFSTGCSLKHDFEKSGKVLNRLVLFTSLLVFLVVGCSSKAVKRQVVEVKAERRQPRAQPAPLASSADKIDPRAFYYFVNATFYELEGNNYLAAVNHRKALQFYPDSYQIRRSLAENLYRIQKFQDALAALKEISPEDSDVHGLRASLYRAIGAEDSARMSCLQVVKLDSTDSRVYSYLAGAYRKLGNLDSTVWAYENLARIKPENYRLWSELAKLQAQKGDYKSAKSSFWSSINLVSDPANTMSFIGLAELYQATQQPDSALIIFNMALEIEPDNILIHRDLANLYIRKDSLAQALPHVRKEAELAPLDRRIVRRLGMLYYWLDSLRVADSLFTFLVESGERSPVNYSYLGRIALRNKDLERACKQFTMVTQLADSVYEGWLDLGYVYRRMGQDEEEIQTYQNGLNHMRDEPSQLRLLFALGAAYEQHDRIEQAVTTFEEIIARAPNYDQALNYLGYMLADRGERLEYAHELIERAVALSPDNAAYLDSYGWVLYRLGSYDKALVHLKKAVALGNDPIMFEHLGDVYEAVGDLKQARDWWQKALEMDPDNEQIKEKLGL